MSKLCFCFLGLLSCGTIAFFPLTFRGRTVVQTLALSAPGRPRAVLSRLSHAQLQSRFNFAGYCVVLHSRAFIQPQRLSTGFLCAAVVRSPNYCLLSSSWSQERRPPPSTAEYTLCASVCHEGSAPLSASTPSLIVCVTLPPRAVT